MKTVKALLLCCAFNSAIVSAQTLRYRSALPYIGLDAYSKLQVNPISFTGNQAALAQVRNAGFGVYGERGFLLSALSSYSVTGVLPTRLGNIGLLVNYSGFKNFNESRVGLAYARSLGAKLDIGIQFNYYGYRIPTYGQAATFTAEAGLMLHLTEALHFGIHIYNPVAGIIGKKNKEKQAAVYEAGLGYDVSPHFFLGTIISREEDQPLTVSAGIQYQFSDLFFVRAGVVTATSVFYGGAGISWRKMRLDISVSHHPQLGFSPGILLVTHFKTAGK